MKLGIYEWKIKNYEKLFEGYLYTTKAGMIVGGVRFIEDSKMMRSIQTNTIQRSYCYKTNYNLLIMGFSYRIQL